MGQQSSAASGLLPSLLRLQHLPLSTQLSVTGPRDTTRASTWVTGMAHSGQEEATWRPGCDLPSPGASFPAAEPPLRHEAAL